MERPRPIIIPGPSGMGSKSFQGSIDLGPLLQYLAGRKKKQEAEELLGRIKDLVPLPNVQEEIPSQGNIAQSHAAQADALDPALRTREALSVLARMAPAQTSKHLLDLFMPTQKERKIEKDVRGVPRYTDTREEVFPGVEEKPEKVSTTQYMYQTEDEKYRWGLFDEGGSLIKDLRPATDKEIKSKPDSPAKLSNMEVVAVSVGIDPVKIRSGKLTQAEATKVLDEYKKRFGVENILSILFGGGAKGEEAAPEIETLEAPAWEEWYAKAKEQNPDATEEELRQFYNEKYGGG